MHLVPLLIKALNQSSTENLAWFRGFQTREDIWAEALHSNSVRDTPGMCFTIKANDFDLQGID